MERDRRTYGRDGRSAERDRRGSGFGGNYDNRRGSGFGGNYDNRRGGGFGGNYDNRRGGGFGGNYDNRRGNGFGRNYDDRRGGGFGGNYDNRDLHGKRNGKKRGRGLLIAGLSLIAAGLLAAVLLFSGLFHLGSGKGGGSEKAENVEVHVNFPEKDDLVLFLGSGQKNQDGSFTVPASVVCGADIKDQTVSVEAEGYGEVLSLSNDGSGKLSGNMTLRPGNEEVLLLQAKAGEKLSNKIPFYGAVEDPEDDFLNQPIDILDGLNSYLAYLGVTDYYSAETIARLEAYLKADPAVADVERVGNGLSFVTTENYLGSYGLSWYTEDIAGFTDGKEVYERAKAGEDVSDKLIQGRSFPTNDRFLIVTPEYSEDSTMRDHTNLSKLMLDEMRSALEYPGETEARTDYDALDCLKNGEFTDYGLVELNAHGVIIQDQLFINLGNGSKDIAFTKEENFVEKGSEKVLDALARKVYVSALKESFGIQDLPGEEERYFRVNLDYTPKPGENEVVDSFLVIGNWLIGNLSVQVSSSYLEHALTDKTFDNTILYLFVCSARSDEAFVQSMLEHGASLVYGNRSTLVSGVSLLSLARITEALATKKANGLYESFASGAYSVDADSAARRLIEITDRAGITGIDSRELVGTYQNPDNERPAAEFGPDHGNMSLKGTAVVTGQVLSGDSKETGVPISGASVKAYRWLDHAFAELPVSAVTDADGKYRLEGVDCGVCIIEAESGGSKAVVLHETGEQTAAGSSVEEAAPILFREFSLIVRADSTHEENEYYTGENLTCTVLIPGKPEASAAVNERLDVFRQNGEKVISDMRSSQYRNNWYMMRMNDAYAGGSAGSVLLSDSTYYGGAHGFYSEFGDNFDLETGEQLTLQSMLNPDNPGAREELRSLMLEYMDTISGAEALKRNVSFENVTDQSLNGEAGGFQLTRDGIRIFYYQYEIGPYIAGMPNYTIPWSRLGSALNAKYLPQSSGPSSGSASMVPAASAGNPVLIQGTPASYAVTAQGLVREVKITQKPEDGTVDKLLFYASSLENGSVYTGETPPEQCSLEWK